MGRLRIKSNENSKYYNIINGKNVTKNNKRTKTIIESKHNQQSLPFGLFSTVISFLFSLTSSWEQTNLHGHHFSAQKQKQVARYCWCVYDTSSKNPLCRGCTISAYNNIFIKIFLEIQRIWHLTILETFNYRKRTMRNPLINCFNKLWVPM